jgi:hypothetical protein
VEVWVGVLDGDVDPIVLEGMEIKWEGKYSVLHDNQGVITVRYCFAELELDFG